MKSWKERYFVMRRFTLIMYVFVIILIIIIGAMLFWPNDGLIHLTVEKDYYKQQMSNFCDLSLNQNQMVRLLLNSTETAKIYLILSEKMYPCDKWFLGGR